MCYIPASLNTATVFTPSFLAVLMILHAISPRLAIRILENALCSVEVDANLIHEKDGVDDTKGKHGVALYKGREVERPLATLRIFVQAITCAQSKKIYLTKTRYHKHHYVRIRKVQQQPQAVPTTPYLDRSSRRILDGALSRIWIGAAPS